tara:strand:+ start:9398 stop:12124 length:2727 start_codon:yes stop_codon:yes gene_type:complete
MARVITIKYFFSIVNYPYVDLPGSKKANGPVIYDVTQSSDNITDEQRTTTKLKVLISDTVPMRRSDFPRDRDEFLKTLVNYEDFYKIFVKKEKALRKKFPELTYPSLDERIEIVLLNVKMYIKAIFKELSILKLPNDTRQRALISDREYYTIVNDWNFIFEPYQQLTEFEYLKDLRERYNLDEDISASKEKELLNRRKGMIFVYLEPNSEKVYLSYNLNNNNQVDKYFIDHKRIFNNLFEEKKVEGDDSNASSNLDDNDGDTFQQDMERVLTMNNEIITNDVSSDLGQIESLLREHEIQLQEKLKKISKKNRKWKKDDKVYVNWNREMAQTYFNSTLATDDQEEEGTSDGEQKALEPLTRSDSSTRDTTPPSTPQRKDQGFGISPLRPGRSVLGTPDSMSTLISYPSETRSVSSSGKTNNSSIPSSSSTEVDAEVQDLMDNPQPAIIDHDHQNNRYSVIYDDPNDQEVTKALKKASILNGINRDDGGPSVASWNEMMRGKTEIQLEEYDKNKRMWDATFYKVKAKYISPRIESDDNEIIINLQMLKKGLFESTRRFQRNNNDRLDIYDQWVPQIVSLWSSDMNNSKNNQKVTLLKSLLQNHNFHEYLSNYDWNRYTSTLNRERRLNEMVFINRKTFAYKLKVEPSENTEMSGLYSEFKDKLAGNVVKLREFQGNDIDFLNLISKQGFNKQITQFSDDFKNAFNKIFLLDGEIKLRDARTPEKYTKLRQIDHSKEGKKFNYEKEEKKDYNMYAFPPFENLVKFSSRGSNTDDDKDNIREFFEKFKNQPNIDERVYEKYFRVPDARKNMDNYEITLKDLVAIKLDPRTPSVLKTKIASHKCTTKKIHNLKNAFTKTIKAYKDRYGVIEKLISNTNGADAQQVGGAIGRKRQQTKRTRNKKPRKVIKSRKI